MDVFEKLRSDIRSKSQAVREESGRLDEYHHEMQQLRDEHEAVMHRMRLVNADMRELEVLYFVCVFMRGFRWTPVAYPGGRERPPNRNLLMRMVKIVRVPPPLTNFFD